MTADDIRRDVLADEAEHLAEAWRASIDDIVDTVNHLERLPMPPIGLDVDIVGRLRFAGRRVNGLARGLETEIEPGTEGDEYKATTGRKARRTYNTGRLIDAFANAGVSFMGLVRDDVIRIGWQWSNLRKAASTYGVTLAITPNEIDDDGDLDGPMVGEVWTTDMRVVGKEAT